MLVGGQARQAISALNQFVDRKFQMRILGAAAAVCDGATMVNGDAWGIDTMPRKSVRN